MQSPLGSGFEYDLKLRLDKGWWWVCQIEKIYMTYLESSKLLDEFVSDDCGLPFPADSRSISHMGWNWLIVICFDDEIVDPNFVCCKNLSVCTALSLLNSCAMFNNSDIVEFCEKLFNLNRILPCNQYDWRCLTFTWLSPVKIWPSADLSLPWT